MTTTLWLLRVRARFFLVLPENYYCNFLVCLSTSQFPSNEVRSINGLVVEILLAFKPGVRYAGLFNFNFL